MQMRSSFSLSLFSKVLLAGVAFAPIAGALAQAPELNEIDKFLAKDGTEFDRSGFDVAIDGDLAVSVARFDNSGPHEGSAYIFARDGSGNWSQERKLAPTNDAEPEVFGTAVALDGNTAVVGAYQRNVGLNSAIYSAYVYVRNSAGTWSRQAKLVANDGSVGNRFGASVAIDGDILVVGAVATAGGGAAYVFARDGAGKWSQRQKLQADDQMAGDSFGYDVAIAGKTILIGAREINEGASPSGRTGGAYVFEQDGSNDWVQVQRLRASDSPDFAEYGETVSLTDGIAVVSARSDSTVVEEGGSVFIFEEVSPGSWVETDKLTAGNPRRSDLFGDIVSIDGRTVVVGVRGPDDSVPGKAYVFAKSVNGDWVEKFQLAASDAAAGDDLGSAIDLDGNLVVVGAMRDDDNGSESGSAYLFDISAASISGGPLLQCPGDINSDGVGELVVVEPDGRTRIKNFNGNWVKSFRFSSLNGLVDLATLDDSNGNSVPDLIALGHDGTEVRDLITGALLGNKQLQGIDDALDLELVGDQNGDGVAEAAALGKSPASVEVFDPRGGGPTDAIGFDNYVVPQDVGVYPNAGGSGFPLLAVLGDNNRDDRSDKLELRDLQTGNKIRDIWLGRGYKVIGQAMISDINGNGSPEAAVVRIANDGSEVSVVIRDTRSKQWLRTHYADADHPPTGFLAIGDTNGNGADEVVVFGQRFDGRNQKAQVIDSASGKFLSTLYFDRNFTGRSIVSCADQNGNGAEEIALLGQRVDGALKVIVKDSKSGSRLGIARF